MCDWQLDQAWYLRRSMVVRWYIVQMLEGNNSDGHAAKELSLLSLDTAVETQAWSPGVK